VLYIIVIDESSYLHRRSYSTMVENNPCCESSEE